MGKRKVQVKKPVPKVINRLIALEFILRSFGLNTEELSFKIVEQKPKTNAFHLVLTRPPHSLPLFVGVLRNMSNKQIEKKWGNWYAKAHENFFKLYSSEDKEKFAKLIDSFKEIIENISTKFTLKETKIVDTYKGFPNA